jgi:CDGSH-type Zn-finger protein/uncharacterized Fe-S cluster protein YjdI
VSRRTYETDRIRVHWDSSKCIHTARCLNAAPEVFDTGRRPWIDVEAADADAVASAVERCPSGALWYERLDDAPGEEPADPTLCVPTEDGPLMLLGDLVVHDEAGEEIATEPRLTLCRCGGTRNPPFCDNSHIDRSFRSGRAEVVRDGPAEPADGPTVVDPQPNGPLRLRGRIVIVNTDGKQLADLNEVFLCRCGRSQSKPFCDGSHRQGFESSCERTVGLEREGAESPGAFAPNSRVEPPASV